VTDIDLDLVPEAVIVVDGDRRVTAVNRETERLTGFSGGELVGAPVAERLRPQRADGSIALDGSWPPGAERLRSVRGIAAQEVVITTASGETRRVTVSGTYRRDADGAIAGAVLSLRPPSRSAGATGIEIVSTVSHELRSPLTSVKGYTSLMLNRWERLGDDQKRMMLEQVHHDADRVTRLVTELLDISRLETGRLVLRRQLVDVATVAQSVVGKVGMEYAELECELSFPEDFPRVYADPDKIEQVLTNLVENAAKYASPKQMRVTGEVLDDEIRVSVHDIGDGIPPEDLPRVFTKFFRRDHGRPTGTGLGLWISRGLVGAHGGRLTASSKQGQGSTFCFTLPLGAFEQLHG
jgi:PAS domain S-box-containing protein